MDEYLHAFSFVDRITSVEAGVQIRGRYAIPSRVTNFPSSLVVEAVGQLAAWSAMAAVEFERRPVAGLAGKVELLSEVRPGQTLELAADLETVDATAAAYGGSAHADGIPVVRLHRCVGPMIPVHDFDDPRALQTRFALLCDRGAVSASFGGVPSFSLSQTAGEAGQWMRATLHVPASDPLFADHFPRRPVFPGTLLMHANLQLVDALAAQLSNSKEGTRWKPVTVLGTKLRSFISPGDTLELETRLTERSGESATLRVETRKENRVVGSARVVLASVEAS